MCNFAPNVSFHIKKKNKLYLNQDISYLTFTFATQVIQYKRIILFLILHILIVVILKRMRPLQSVDGLLPGIVVVYDPWPFQIDNFL